MRPALLLRYRAGVLILDSFKLRENGVVFIGHREKFAELRLDFLRLRQAAELAVDARLPQPYFGPSGAVHGHQRQLQ